MATNFMSGKAGEIARRVVALVLALALGVCIIPSAVGLKAEAANVFPSLSDTSYAEYVAPGTIPCWANPACTVRGNARRSNYNACATKGDKCYITYVSSSYSIWIYPAGSTMTKAYVRTADLFKTNSTPEYVISRAKVSVNNPAKSNGSYGEVWVNDRVYRFGADGNYYVVCYDSRSGNRAFKIGLVTKSDWDKIVGKTTNGIYAPLKGGLTRSSSCKTNGQYCDYRAAKGTPIYAPADGTVQFRQTYAVNYGKLSSYGNNVVFTSDSGGLTVTMAHLSSFNGVGLKYTSSLSYPCGASKYSSKTITLATRHVRQGELIGYTGDSGNASGPHLHIEAKQNGNAVNPVTFFKNW